MRNHNAGADQARSPELLSRRELLAAGAGLTAALLIAGATAAAQRPEPKRGKGTMKSRKLGRMDATQMAQIGQD